MSTVAPGARLGALAALLGEVSDLKRIRVAGADGSLAERAFARSWAAIVSGEEPRAVALRETARALAATRLAGVDHAVLRDGGLSDDAARAVLRAAVRDAGTGVVAAELLESLLATLDHPAQAGSPSVDGGNEIVDAVNDGPGTFVGRLVVQPRAGATAVGTARVMVEPPESHGDHCFGVAVGAVLLAPDHGADVGDAFLGALVHHLHNAWLPDSGFGGEVLLGEHLGTLMTTFTERALAELDAPVAERVRGVLGLNEHLDTPEARAVVAADVLDRVLQMRHHAQAASFSLEQALDEHGLVHEGPLQAYGLDVVEQAGLR